MCLRVHSVPEPPHGRARTRREQERPVEERPEELELGQRREQVQQPLVRLRVRSRGRQRRERRAQLDERRQEVDALVGR